MKKPIVEYTRKGPRGNVYYILGQVRDALRKQHRITDYTNKWERVQNCHSYEEALDIMKEYVELVEKD
jgi:hypothetical protein